MDDLKTKALVLTQRLEKMSDDQRYTFISGVLRGLNKAVDVAINDPSMAKQLKTDFERDSYIIIGCLLYSIEPRYRPLYVELLAKGWQVV